MMLKCFEGQAKHVQDICNTHGRGGGPNAITVGKRNTNYACILHERNVHIQTNSMRRIYSEYMQMFIV